MSQKPDEARWTDTVVMANAGCWDGKRADRGAARAIERAARDGFPDSEPTPSCNEPPTTPRD